jgi:hypothetical protein
MTLADEFTPEPVLVETILQCIIAERIAPVAGKLNASLIVQWHVHAQHIETLASQTIAADWLARLIFRHTYNPKRILLFAHIRLAKPHKTGFSAISLKGEFDPAAPAESFRARSYAHEYNTVGFREWR